MRASARGDSAGSGVDDFRLSVGEWHCVDCTALSAPRGLRSGWKRACCAAPRGLRDVDCAAVCPT
eukprot:6306461-Pyramimonas_sp.AAC.1